MGMGRKRESGDYPPQLGEDDVGPPSSSVRVQDEVGSVVDDDDLLEPPCHRVGTPDDAQSHDGKGAGQLAVGRPPILRLDGFDGG